MEGGALFPLLGWYPVSFQLLSFWSDEGRGARHVWSRLRFGWLVRTFLGLRMTGVLTLTGVTALSSVVDTPLEEGAVRKGWVSSFCLTGTTWHLASFTRSTPHD